MSRSRSGLLVLALAVTSAPMGNAGNASTVPAPAAFSTPASRLSALATPWPTRAKPDLLKVAFFGGSITEGAFSTTPERSYAGLLSSWLATKYRKVESRNFGFGGTGSEFAVYRVEHDLGGFVPDLVFLEFTVNDAGTSRPAQASHLDSIIWKLRQINPQVKVVYLATTDVGEEADRRAGRRAAFVEDAASAARYNDVQYIDIAAALWARVIGGTPASTFLTDNVHPNDAGHQLYFEAARDGLASAIPLTTQPRSTTSRLIGLSKLGTARMDKGLSATGCRAGTLALPYMEAATTCNEGESFTYQFTGTTIGLLKAETRDGGRLSCTIDGGTPITADFYSEANRTYERPFPIFLAHGLASGQHTLACRVTSDVISLPTGTSTGHKVTIGYFMVSDERSVTLP